jgi:uncharacterized protein YndB with AHSA1/START domain
MKTLKVTTDVPTEITMTRTFDAPRRLVIQAMMTPELVKRWLGGTRTEVIAAELDRRVGGAYLWRFRTPDGHEFQFSGVIKELSDDRVVMTEKFDDMPNESVVTTTYVEANGLTTMTVTMAFDSQETRDMVVGTGMADGAGESYDALETLLTTL